MITPQQVCYTLAHTYSQPALEKLRLIRFLAPFLSDRQFFNWDCFRIEHSHAFFPITRVLGVRGHENIWHGCCASDNGGKMTAGPRCCHSVCPADWVGTLLRLMYKKIQENAYVGVYWFWYRPIGRQIGSPIVFSTYVIHKILVWLSFCKLQSLGTLFSITLRECSPYTSILCQIKIGLFPIGSSTTKISTKLWRWCYTRQSYLKS